MPQSTVLTLSPSLTAVQAVAGLSIGIAFLAMAVAVGLFVQRERNLPLRNVCLALVAFMVCAGLMHFADVLLIIAPYYWLDASLRVVAAITSIGAAFVLPRLLPRALALVNGAELARERGLALEAAVADLDAMYKKSLALDDMKTKFFANVSHELRTPLALILGPVEQMLRRDGFSQDTRIELDGVARNARTLLKHVNDLLDIARLDAGKLEPRYTELDLGEFVRGTAASFESLARERQIELRLLTPPTLSAQVDGEKLQRALVNLLSNAFKFTPRGGSVHVELTVVPERRAARLAVSDSGPGVPLVERGRIFERFQQGSASHPAQGSGTGLGLAIVREFVTLQGGQVSLEESAQGGAAFIIELPLHAPEGARVQPGLDLSETTVELAIHELTRSSPSVAESIPVSESSQIADAPLVLLVEDNADMRRLLVKTLSPRYRIAQACDGLEGIAQARALRPDLILTDVMMPGASGEELVLAVRETPTLNAVPIILLTAKSDEDLRTRALESGAQDYVLKPFSTDELLARVQNLLTLKRTRDLLQREVEAQQGDLEALSHQVVAQKRELSRALDAARRARIQAEEASRAKSDFLSLISHELRTPLTSIQLQLERLRRGVVGIVQPEQMQIFEKIARSSARLLDLLESLLEFGRIESGRLEVKLDDVDVALIAREVLDELRPRADQKGLALSLALGNGPAIVHTDARLMRLIIANLVDNAVKYTERGSISVQLELLRSGSARIRVSDTGSGIAPSLQQMIFEPFQQLEHVRHKRGDGVGLGLALVKSIAHALHADVAVQSELGQGSSFTVTLSAN